MTRLRIWWHIRRKHYDAVIICDRCGSDELMDKALFVYNTKLVGTSWGEEPWYALCRRCWQDADQASSWRPHHG